MKRERKGSKNEKIKSSELTPRSLCNPLVSVVRAPVSIAKMGVEHSQEPRADQGESQGGEEKQDKDSRGGIRVTSGKNGRLMAEHQLQPGEGIQQVIGRKTKVRCQKQTGPSSQAICEAKKTHRVSETGRKRRKEKEQEHK